MCVYVYDLKPLGRNLTALVCMCMCVCLPDYYYMFVLPETPSKGQYYLPFFILKNPLYYWENVV